MWAAAILSLLLFLGADFTAEGMKALEERKYQEAADLFTKAVAADPSDYAANFNLALAYSLLGKPADAIPAYKKTLELKPGLYEAELNLGILLIGQKQPADAVPLLQDAVEKKPKEFRPRNYLSKALLDSGDFAKAEESYKIGVQLDSKSAAAQLGLAQAQARQNRLGDAAEHYRQAAALDPSYKDTLLELATLYEANKQAAEAIEIYRQYPENTAAQEHLGALLIETQRYAESIDRLAQVVEKDPTSANYLALAHAYQLNKELDKAVPVLEKAVAADPSNYDLHMIYGSCLRDQKKLGAAANQFYAATQKRPDSVAAWNELAALLTVMEDYPRALAALDRVKALGGETPGDLFFRAIILDKMASGPVPEKSKRLKLALEAYETFLAASHDKFPDQEFQARQRARIIQRELTKR
jgi:tetratricopeptide (TPR) repeat protein